MFTYIPIEQLLYQSIMAINDIELRKKFSNLIILSGGFTKTKGFIDYLEDKLIEKLSSLDSNIERVEVINIPNADNKTLSWIGGTILPKIESSKDMWINREKWLCELEKYTEKIDKVVDRVEDIDEISIKPEKDVRKKKERQLDGGMKLLREKCPFKW